MICRQFMRLEAMEAVAIPTFSQHMLMPVACITSRHIRQRVVSPRFRVLRIRASIRGSRYRRNDDFPKKDGFSDASLVPVTIEHSTSWFRGSRRFFKQVWKIFEFAGPALGIWIFSPVMSLIDTSVIGNSSTLELAALAPATVLCDYVSYVFMFLTVATSNLVATSLAQEDEVEARAHLARLLLISLGCGVTMLAFMEINAVSLLSTFLSSENAYLVLPASLYVKIRALSWPAMLVGMVAQSAILGMGDSFSPLKALAIAGVINAVGDVLLCTYLGYGIAGAAWATTFAQYIAVALMLRQLTNKGYNVFAVRIPSIKDMKQLLKIIVPVFTTTVFEVIFYSICTYLATSLGALALAAHQVMIGIHSLCYVWGEPLAQTALTFMPALMNGSTRNLTQARLLLVSLLALGGALGLLAGCSAISIPWFAPQIFTRDAVIIEMMRSLTMPVMCTLLVTPAMLAMEGVLLAGRDLRFLGLAMVGCYSCGISAVLAFHRAGFGLPGFWWALFLTESARLVMALARLTSSGSVLADKKLASS